MLWQTCIDGCRDNTGPSRKVSASGWGHRSLHCSMGAMVTCHLGCEFAEPFLIFIVEMEFKEIVKRSVGLFFLLASFLMHQSWRAESNTPVLSNASSIRHMANASETSLPALVASVWALRMHNQKSWMGSSGFHATNNVVWLALISLGVSKPYISLRCAIWSGVAQCSPSQGLL